MLSDPAPVKVPKTNHGAGEARAICDGHASEGIWDKQAEQGEERNERQADCQIEEDRTHDAMIGDAPGRKHGLANPPNQNHANQQPRTCIQTHI